MKKTQERIESLAAEYVLGSLRGPARRRFERWMMESSLVRKEVWYWEEKLSGLASSVPEIAPPERVWSVIENRLWPAPVRFADTAREPRRTVISSWLWPSWSALATAAALVLMLLLVQQPLQQPAPMLSGAIVAEDNSTPLWLVREDEGDGRLRLKPVAATAAAPDQDYELWVVPGEGSPLSLGVIKAGGGTLQIELTKALRAALLTSRTLAISLEPAGGSPTGAPTGPILHVAKLYEL